MKQNLDFKHHTDFYLIIYDIEYIEWYKNSVL